jgi:hypothetical protein
MHSKVENELYSWQLKRDTEENSYRLDKEMV